MKTIQIQSGVKYLSDSVNTLPANSLFDKGRVGCGGTTLAINSNHPYVIAVPFVSLIENKVAQHSNILGVHEKTTTKEIKEYLQNTTTPIIMTTYDSLERVGKYINTEDYKLLVDEYHLLFTQYGFRDKAINSLLKQYKNYKEYCFMTATPLEEEFILDELKDLDLVSAVWEDVVDVTVKSVKCLNGVINTTVDLVNAFLKGDEVGNLYLFVNSVNFIKEVVSACNLTVNNCNVIYSKNNKTEVGIERGVLPNKKDGSIPTKKVNLLTSTVFEGSDIYDENGRIFIVSDASKSHTLTDISTSFQQIAGRVRNSLYLNEIHHLYTNTRYTDLSYEDFKSLSNKEIEIAKKATESFNSLSEDTKTYLISAGLGKVNETYISLDNNNIIFNPNLVKLDIYNFKVCKHLYKIRVNNLGTELNKYGYNQENYTHKTETKISISDLEGFESVVKNVKQLLSKGLLTVEDSVYIEAAYLKYPFLSEAINVLGFEGIESENYVQTNIKRKLAAAINTNQETKVYKMLKTYDDIHSGNFVPSATLKSRLSEIYKSLGINKTAKGSDIGLYFNVKSTQKKINGKTVEGYLIQNSKIIIK